MSLQDSYADILKLTKNSTNTNSNVNPIPKLSPKIFFKSITVVLLFPFMFFGWFFGLTTTAISWSESNFVRNSQEVVGYVSSSNVLKSCSSTKSSSSYRSASTSYSENCSDQYSIKYSYSVNNKEYSGFSNVDSSVYSNIVKQDKIKVYYDKNNVTDSKTEFNVNKLGVFGIIPVLALSVAFISTTIFIIILTRKSK